MIYQSRRRSRLLGIKSPVSQSVSQLLGLGFLASYLALETEESLQSHQEDRLPSLTHSLTHSLVYLDTSQPDHSK